MRERVGNENRSVGADGYTLGSPEGADAVAGSADVAQPIALRVEDLHAVVEQVHHAHVAVRSVRQPARQRELPRPTAVLADSAEVFAGRSVEDFDAVRRQHAPGPELPRFDRIAP